MEKCYNRLKLELFKVAFSIQGKQSIFKIATTNDLGNFYFNVQEEYDNPYAIIQVVNNEKNNFNIMVDGHSSINYENLDFYNFKITPETKDYILKRSIYNQIENVYSIIKPNINKSIDSVSPFFNSKAKVVHFNCQRNSFFIIQALIFNFEKLFEIDLVF